MDFSEIRKHEIVEYSRAIDKSLETKEVVVWKHNDSMTTKNCSCTHCFVDS